MLKKMLVVVAMSAVAVTAFANDYARREAKQVVELKDGSTVYNPIFSQKQANLV